MIYKLNKSLIPSLKKKALQRNIGVFLIVFVAVAVMQKPQSHEDLVTKLIVGGMVLIGYAIAMLFLARKTGERFESLGYALNDEYIETVGIQRFERIKYENAKIVEKPDGGVIIYDKSIKRSSSKWNGKGMISIMPEIENRGEFLEEIVKRIKT